MLKIKNTDSNVHKIFNDRIDILCFHENFFLQYFNILSYNDIESKRKKISQYCEIDYKNLYYIHNNDRQNFLLIDKNNQYENITNNFAIALSNIENKHFFVQADILPKIILYDQKKSCLGVMNFNIHFIKTCLLKKMITCLNNFGADLFAMQSLILQSEISDYKLMKKEYEILMNADRDVYQFIYNDENNNLYINIVKYLKFLLQTLGVNFTTVIKYDEKSNILILNN